MPDEIIPTDSVPVVVAEPPAFNSEDTSTWTPTQKDEWVKTGKITAPPKKQDSAPASTPEKKATVTEPKGKSAAESGAAPKQEKPGKQNAEDRIAELVADRNRLEERLRKLESPPQATSKQEVSAKPAEAPKRPNAFTWTGTPEDFDKAMEAYEIAREANLRQQVTRETEHRLQMQQVNREMDDMVAKTTEKYPDAKQKIAKTATELSKTPVFLQAYIGDSEHLGDLMYVLSDDATMSKLLDTAKTSPNKALRVIRDMERDIEQALKKPVKTEEAKETPVKPEPRAPKTPPEVGGRGSAVDDPAKAAARSGNFTAFSEQMNNRYRQGA